MGIKAFYKPINGGLYIQFIIPIR